MRKEFCIYHVKTKENPEGVDCAAEMASARVFACNYSFEDIKYDKEKEKFYISKIAEGQEHRCINFELKSELEEELKKILRTE